MEANNDTLRMKREAIDLLQMYDFPPIKLEFILGFIKNAGVPRACDD